MAFGSIAPSYDPMTGLPIGVPDVVPTGQLEAGNIDLNKRPVVRNADGSISTVLTKGFNFGGPEVNIPTVGHDGTILSDADAIKLYRLSGKHLGKFDTPEHAGAAAAQLHNDQAALYAPQPPRFGSMAPAAEPDWREREAQEGLALQQADKIKAERAGQSWGDLAKEIPGNLAQMMKGLVAPARPADPNAPPSLGPAAFGTLSPGEAALQPETTGGRVVRGVGNMVGEAVKSGFTAPHDVMTGDIPQFDAEGHTSPEMIHRGFDTASLAGGASVAGTAERAGAKALEGTLDWHPPALASDSGKPGGVIAAAERLPMDEAARLARAKEQGFDVDKKWYHSALNPIEEFDPYGKFMGRSGTTGIHLTDNPKMASRYLDRYGELNYKGDPFQKNIMPVYVKPGKVLERQEPFRSDVPMGHPIPEGYQSPVEKMGYDALLRQEAISSRGGVKHVDPESPRAVVGNEMVLTDPSRVRSVSAEFSPEHAGKPGLLLSDTSKPGAAIAAAGHAPPFYSGLERAVTEAPIKKATGEQWLGTLSNRPGVKPEEMDWTGLRSFLEEKRGQPVTKEEVAAHVGENKLQLGEVHKGGGDVEVLAKQLAEEENGPGSWDRIGGGGQEHYWRDARHQLGAKFEGYQLPGGENYREKLLTLPRAETTTGDISQKLFGKPMANLSEAERDAVVAEMRNAPRGEGADFYNRNHWDEPNVLVHRRTNERDVGGVPSLHVEELQSDWHQAGRKQGYTIPGNAERANEIHRKMDKISEEVGWTEASKDPRFQALEAELEAVSTKNPSGVPDAPFKKNWHELAIKDAIREAAEKGIDRISITPGAAQAERYSLAKRFNHITVVPTGDGGKVLWPKTVHGQDGGSITVDASGKVVKANRDWGDIVGKNLDDAVGKDVADRAMKAEKETKLSGVDLSVGGEGMKGFYDKIVPDALNKIGKPHGVKVQSGTSGSHYSLVDKEGKPGQSFASKAEADAWFAKNPRASEFWDLKKDEHPVHYMDIPPSLKEQALKKGFSLFEDTGPAGTAVAAAQHVLENPKFKKWFGDSKVVDAEGKPLVVYHGTNQPIEHFDLARGGSATGANAGATDGFFFTDSRQVADQYAANAGERVVSNIAKFEKEQARLKKEVDRLERVAQRTGDWAPYEAAMSKWEDLEIGATREDPTTGANIVDAHLSIKNPMDIDYKGGRLSPDRDVGDLIKEAKAAGHDGLILRNLEDSPKMGTVSTHYVAFKPEQIKSATGNSGEFNPKNKSIFAEDAGKAGAAIAAAEHTPKDLGFGPLDVHPNERALTVNDILAPSTPSMKPGSRDVETIAKELMDRGSSALKKMGVEGGRIEESAPHTDELLSRGIASEIKAALGRGNSASDWYTKKISEAMDIAGEMHPELKNDPHQKMAFTSALAITSQGEAVTSNVRLANQVYQHFKDTGRFPDKIDAKNGPAMVSNFHKMNALLDELGPEGTREFLHKEFTVKELEQAGYDVGGENKQTKVYGSSILGPKIGQGFYQNLNGNYKPVTMDLWFMRAWGRMTGTLVGKTDMSKPLARFQDAIRAEGGRVPKDPAKLDAIARQTVLEHERDFRTNRPAYDSGKKKKSELTASAERYEKNKFGINEQPTSGSQRQWMRDVVNRAREILADHGHKVTNADLQAIWWYPEKELYSKLGGRDSDKINIDYATALRDLKAKGAASSPEPAAVRPASGGRPADKANVPSPSKGGGAGSKKAARQKVSSFGSLAPGLA